MKKLFTQIIGLFVVAAIVSLPTGCSREADVEIFNNTDAVIKIILTDMNLLLKKKLHANCFSGIL